MTTQKLKVMVTGANGFVGSHILETLQTLPEIEPIASCRDRNKLAPHFSGEIREGDLTNADDLEPLVTGVDVICHAAAWTALWNHKQASHDYFLIPSLNLIKAAQKAGVKKFIFTSTTSAAAPTHSQNPLNPGIPRKFWPHLNNVIRIENTLRKAASANFHATVLRLGLFIGDRYGLGMYATNPVASFKNPLSTVD